MRTLTEARDRAVVIVSGAKVRELEADGLRVVPREAADWLIAEVEDPEDPTGDQWVVRCMHCGAIEAVLMTEWHGLGGVIVPHARHCPPRNGG